MSPSSHLSAALVLFAVLTSASAAADGDVGASGSDTVVAHSKNPAPSAALSRPVDAATPSESTANAPASSPSEQIHWWVQTLGWFVWSFVAAGVLIIISARLRETAELRTPSDRSRPDTSDESPLRSPAGNDRPNATAPPTQASSVSTPAKIESVLARLGESFGESGSGVDERDPVGTDRPGGGTGGHTVDELMTRVLSTAGLLVGSEQTGDLLSGATIAARQTTEKSPLMIGEEFGIPASHGAARSSASAAENAGHSMRRRTDDLDKSERRRFEEFRQISRRSSYAEISRCHRERMREQWMAVGVTALATGTVCVVSACFAEMSLPIGFVLISVSLTLLMRRPLYPPTPRRHVTDFLDDVVPK